jgi:septal ring factor EnvC (AmiA/AmiB activator)
MEVKPFCFLFLTFLSPLPFALELPRPGFYCRLMKRIFVSSLALLCAAGSVLAQDAATEERLNKLAGQIENLVEAQRAQQKQLEALSKEIDNLRDQVSKPAGNYASQDEVKHLANLLREVDRKRMDDVDRISSELSNLAKSLRSAPATKPVKPTSSGDSSADSPPKNEKGYTHVVQQGDTISAIIAAYREKNIKVTEEQIRKANPNLKPERMAVGTKIWIPAP